MTIQIFGRTIYLMLIKQQNTGNHSLLLTDNFNSSFNKNQCLIYTIRLYLALTEHLLSLCGKNIGIYIVYRYSAKIYRDMTFGPYRPALQCNINMSTHTHTHTHT